MKNLTTPQYYDKDGNLVNLPSPCAITTFTMELYGYWSGTAGLPDGLEITICSSVMHSSAITINDQSDLENYLYDKGYMYLPILGVQKAKWNNKSYLFTLQYMIYDGEWNFPLGQLAYWDDGTNSYQVYAPSMDTIEVTSIHNFNTYTL